MAARGDMAQTGRGGAMPGKAPGARRALILQATIDVIRERGYSGTRVSDIAAAAGTSVGLVIYHFGSLAGAMAAALEAEEDQFYEQVERDLRDVESAADQLRTLIHLAVGAGGADAEWQLWVETWAHGLHDESTRQRSAAHERRWHATLRGILEAGVTRGEFVISDVDTTIDHLSALLDGLVVRASQDGSAMTPERVEYVWLQAAWMALGVAVDSATTADSTAAPAKRGTRRRTTRS